MKAKDLIKALKMCDPETPVRIESSDGEYSPMDINSVTLENDPDKKPQCSEFVLIEGCYRI